MTNTGTVGLLLILLTVIFSYRGFISSSFFERYNFQVDKILIYKDYKRLLTSGFLHLNWTHLIFNMLGLLFFSSSLESFLGLLKFLLIYFGSLVGGNLLALFIHRNHKDYSAAGASGAISGVIFASIALFPGMSIGLFPLPIQLPGWIYGLLFILFSIYGIRSRKDNIGHDAHLGGALIGILLAVIIIPSALIENYPVILLITLPILLFLYLIISRPGFLLVDNFFFKAHKDFYSIDHKYNTAQKIKQSEIDRILDKINKRGMSSLTAKEKQALKEFSEK